MVNNIDTDSGCARVHLAFARYLLEGGEVTFSFQGLI